ncbi:TPA: hypothetical protein LC219_002147 [Salmonella enterica subsp. enterica serovar Teltow]|uniref:Uncharacterized protein n=1 Tax=Salmonella enterica subsp. enterica serovar Abeokuta TaxID=2926665 RepID=A0A8T9IRA8_SALET|nr:hypothetical protein [Salmonella enterica]ELD7744680.1 hypothetical protein [Salmonella enterica subsp. enterica serovar Lome]HBJ6332800.1 hypothetical protein [Salmonella enterica subsp. enterica serovar Teltow]EHF3438933.1 hypothetical protein [Salmonella enterica]EHH4974270.1 hypothetical protein [Salmonella enterica]EHL7732299.1 hypothetical protein [Salmonella enterica]
MTKIDRIWLSRVAALGCIVCKNLGLGKNASRNPPRQNRTENRAALLIQVVSEPDGGW